MRIIFGLIASVTATISLVVVDRLAAASAEQDQAAIRPFTVPIVPQKDLDDLRRRIAATRWPENNPIAGSAVSVAMMTKGGLNAAVKSLSSEYAKEHIRFNAVAPGAVKSPLHAGIAPELLAKLTPVASITTIEDVASAVVYLTEAHQTTGEVLHVDGGAHVGKW